MNRSFARAMARPRVVVAVAALLAFAGLALYRAQSSAGAHETYVTMKMACAVAGPITVDYTVNHEPEAGAVVGQPFTIDTKSVVALNPTAPEVGIKGLTITIPNPSNVTSGGDIMVMGGNLTKASQTVEGNNTILKMNANAGVTSKTLQNPELMIPVTIAPAAAGIVLNFQGPSKFELAVDFGGQPVTETCNADAANPPLLSIKPSGGTTPTTAAPTTAAPTTAAPPTTRMTPPTTVTPPTTRMTPPTTVTPPTTRMTPPTTVTPPTTRMTPPTTVTPPTTRMTPPTTVTPPTTRMTPPTRPTPPGTGGHGHGGPPPGHGEPPHLPPFLMFILEILRHLFHLFM